MSTGNESSNWRRSQAGWLLLGVAAITLFFLWEEHKARLLGALPYLLLLACPLMHLFHGRHGGNHHHERKEQ